MFYLAAPLASVLESAHGFAAGLVEANEFLATLPGARAFINESKGLLGLSRASVLWTKETKQLLNQIRLELEAQEKAINELERTCKESKPHGVSDHSQKLQAASQKLLEHYAQLQHLERQEKVYSPVPLLDQIMKVGMNVLTGNLEARELRLRMSTAVDVVAQLRHQVEMFNALYDNAELKAVSQQAIGGLESGLGALTMYFQTGGAEALEDGLRLIGSSSTVLHGIFAKMNEFAKAQQKFSPHPYLEEFCRALEKGLVPDRVRACWSKVERAVHHYRTQLETLGRLPVAIKYEAELAQGLHSCERVEADLKRVAGKLRPLPSGSASLEIPVLNQALTELTDLVKALWTKLEADSKTGGKAPTLEGMLETLSRAAQGAVPATVLKGLLTEWRRSHEILRTECSRSTGETQQRILGLLMSHQAGFEEVEQFFVDGDRTHLKRAFQLIEPTMAPLAELNADLERRVRPRSAVKRTVNCFRCGTENPTDRRMCQSCGAVLPVVPTAPVETFEITGDTGGGVRSSPDNVVEFLEALCDAAEANQVPRKAFNEAVESLLVQADQSRKMFERQLIPMMGQSPELDTYLRVFAQAVGAYVQSLLALRDFRTIHQLHSAAAEAQDAAQALGFMKDSIDKALQG